MEAGVGTGCAALTAAWLREGRQIDVVQPTWTKSQNHDVYLKIEIDFDPVLNEFFSITTSKQQIRIDDDMAEKLLADGKNAGGLKSLD